MIESKPTAAGTDWTGLLSDPDLARNLGKLLQIYRDAPAEKREAALLAAMQEIKRGSTPKSAAPSASAKAQAPALQPVPIIPEATPPFEPDIFTPSSAQDRRRHPRIKCFVAVELHVDNADAPVWGNLSNTSLGGCLVETAGAVKSGSNVEIGLWVASGKIWVKGFVVSGVVTRGGPTSGVRVRFEMSPAEREHLRQFLKYVQATTRASSSEGTYLQLLK